jgi:ubiquinone/menaquinone biosynthesis C-methylase UbiE
MHELYDETLQKLMANGILRPDMSILVCCGGAADRDALRRQGFGNVLITNIRSLNENEFAPYGFSEQDAEQLTLPDDSFDFCAVQSGLHHCRSPHQALLEMYRVAKKGVLLLEPGDTLISRLGARLGFGQEYEHHAVTPQGGGVANTPIPNYVYRWTRNEIRKTISSFAPHARHRFLFFDRLDVHWGSCRRKKCRWYYYIMLAGYPLLKALNLCFPRLTSNSFGAVILKPTLPADLHPWLSDDKGKVIVNTECLDRIRHRQPV